MSKCNREVGCHANWKPPLQHRKAYSNLLVALPGLVEVKQMTSTSTTRPQTLQRADYTNVKYWEKGEWLAEEKRTTEAALPGTRGGARAAQGINVSLLFVENTDGTPVSGARASSMREQAKTIFKDLHERNKAPQTWSKLSEDKKERYAQRMEEIFPELRLCQAHWKAHHIARNVYPSWIKHRTKKDSVKSEGPEESDGSLKRGAEAEGGNGLEDSRRKRIRADASAEAPVDVDVGEAVGAPQEVSVEVCAGNTRALTGAHLCAFLG